MQSIDYYNSYDIVVRRYEGKTYAIIDELSLIASGETVQDAVDNVSKQRDELIEKYKESDALGRLAMPRDQARVENHAISMSSMVRTTAYKTFAVVLVLSFLALPVGWAASRIMATIVADIKTEVRTIISPRQTIREIAELIETLSNQQIDPAREEEIKGNLRNLVSRLKPYTNELAPLFSGQEKN